METGPVIYKVQETQRVMRKKRSSSVRYIVAERQRPEDTFVSLTDYSSYNDRTQTWLPHAGTRNERRSQHERSTLTIVKLARG
jgi:hypothetical protein